MTEEERKELLADAADTDMKIAVHLVVALDNIASALTRQAVAAEAAAEISDRAQKSIEASMAAQTKAMQDSTAVMRESVNNLDSIIG